MRLSSPTRETKGTPRSLAGWTAALVLSLLGCGQQPAGQPPDDEPMRWAQYDGKPAKVAAREYFLPSYYFDASKPLGGVPNYFRGMDRIVVRPGWQADRGEPPLQTPVYQLLSAQQPAPTFELVDDPVRTTNEILGRNTWMIWCGGNEGFWDWLSRLGFIDLLKLIDSRNRATRFSDAGLINEPGMVLAASQDEFGLWLDSPANKETRQWRSEYLRHAFDLIRDRKHPSQRGLDEPATAENRRAYAGAMRYQGPADVEAYEGYGEDGGSKDGVYSDIYRRVPPPEIYGLSSGVVGLRLFPNPNFDAAARNKWDAKRYYDDQQRDYWLDPKLIRPYRVGMSCAFCHASFHPLKPPRDITQPGWENISGNIGAQYLRVRAVFANVVKPDNFVYHILDSQPPGTIDTSLIASDNINNPNAMNSVFNLPQRALLSFRNPQERLAAASRSQPSLWQHPEANPPQGAKDAVPSKYRELFAGQKLGSELEGSTDDPRYVPRILFDGADSIGAWGALARVYLNIGTYYEQWIRLHRPVVGFDPQKAFTIGDCESHSVYWHATQLRVPALRDYFLKVTPPMPLLATPGGSERTKPIDESNLRQRAKVENVDYAQLLATAKARRVDVSKLKAGRAVFARNCIVCHSSIQPESSAVTLFTETQKQEAHEKQYAGLIKLRKARRAEDTVLGEFWEHDPGQWLRNKDYLDWAEEVVESEAFWRLNYLSTDYRIPINLVRTNAGRAMATNALDGSMWDDFASESYQHMPSVGPIDFFNPYKGKDGAWYRFTPRHHTQRGVPPGGGGPGFYRVPTLVSIWATAPLLHNNSLGLFNNDPSVDGRLAAFDDAIRKLLWPEKRLESSSYNGATAERLKKDHGLIWRTTEDTYLDLSPKHVPALLASQVPLVMKLTDKYPWLDDVRPLWLPSALLLSVGFLLLIVDSPRARLRLGLGLVVLVALTLIAYWLHEQFGWFPWLDTIRPLWLPIAIASIAAVFFLAISDEGKARLLGYAALVLAALGFVLYLLNGTLGWLKWMDDIGPHSLPAALLLLLALVLLRRDYPRASCWLGWVALALAVIGIAVSLVGSYFGWWTETGPPWLVSILLLTATLILWAPNYRMLTHYVGYATLIVALLVGGLVYFRTGRLGGLRIGPIPKGTPVNLVANVNPDADPNELSRAVKVAVGTLAEIESKHFDHDKAEQLLRKIAPELIKVSKCPDFVMDQGHYYEWFKQMSDDDKESLIELLKTF